MEQTTMLLSSYSKSLIEAGCDEAGRGCLAGPVAAAAVILPHNFFHPLLNDSKQITAEVRNELRTVIERDALAWSVAFVDHTEIDRINILNASFLAMHKAINSLKRKPELLLIDGNRFKPHPNCKHKCFVKGDARYASIAAASVLAKTHRDEFMSRLHDKYPHYQWKYNKAYATRQHIDAILNFGFSPYHRKSFHLKIMQTEMEFSG